MVGQSVAYLGESIVELGWNDGSKIVSQVKSTREWLNAKFIVRSFSRTITKLQQKLPQQKLLYLTGTWDQLLFGHTEGSIEC